MRPKTLLPADTYIVYNKALLHVEDRKLLTLLYQPIIGSSATSLYLTLLDDLMKEEIMSDVFTHHHLMATTQLSLEALKIAREKLEGIGLLKTYVKEETVHQYLYLLYAPLDAASFLNHPVLSIVLYNNIGKKEYDKLVSYFQVPVLKLKGYQDITSKFTDVFESTSLKSFELLDTIRVKEMAAPLFESQIDFNLLISSIPKDMVHEKCFNTDTKQLINALAFTYHLDTITMQNLVRDALTEKGMIDKMLLRKNCRNFYQFEQGGKLPTMIYRKQPDFLKKPEGDVSNWAKMVYTFENLTPYEYLKSKYKSGKPTKRDLQLVEELMVDQKLNPGVVNVLLAYSLSRDNAKLSRNYVETLAGQFKRLHIETVEDAMRLTEKEHKKIKNALLKTTKTRQVRKEEPVPEWFGKEQILDQAGEEEKKEMDSILSKLA